MPGQGRICLVRHRRNRGFPAAINGGIRAARRWLGAADILLLNSDTTVPPGTAGQLHDLLYAEPEIVSVTPLSNEATIMSYPRRCGGNPCPDPAEVSHLDHLARRGNGTRLIEIPTAIGFCLAILLQPDFSHLAAIENAERNDAAPTIGRTRVGDRYAADYPNLLYALPREWPTLLRLLCGARVRHVEFHHVMGHDPSIRTLADRLGVPADHVVHDYACICERVNLISLSRRYCGACGEPGPAGCAACIAEGDVPFAEFRTGGGVPRPQRRLVPERARFWHRPTMWHDACAGLPSAASIVVTPWEDDVSLPPARPPRPGRRRIALAGGIGPAKGYDIVLCCADDAATRDLPLDFLVIGAADGEQTLIDTGRVLIGGPCQEGQAESLIRRADAALGFLPSIWPEIWCFALSELWRAGLYVLAFDLGAQAERMRKTGRGSLLPLGLPPSRINDALLAWTPDLRDLPGRSPAPPDEIRSPALSLP